MSYRKMDGDGHEDKWRTENRLKHNPFSVEVNFMVPCCLGEANLFSNVHL